MKGYLSTQKKNTIVATINNDKSVSFFKILSKDKCEINSNSITFVNVFDYDYNELSGIMDSLVDYSGCSYFTKDYKPELFLTFKN